MSITIRMESRELNRGMDQLIKLSGIADQKVIWNTTKGVMMNLVRFTFLMKRRAKKKWKAIMEARAKHSKGRARLGWWPAWKHLQMNGSPKIGNGPLKDRGEGGIIDNSRRIGKPFITVFNEVPYIGSSEKKMRTTKRAMANQAKFLARAIDREYGKILGRTIG